MCRTTAHKYTCGHTHAHHLSPCRLTYLSPTSRAPLCSPAASAQPDLILRVRAKCHNCQYEHFVQRWQRRIADISDKADHLRMLMGEFGGNACSELDDGWGPDTTGWPSPRTPGTDPFDSLDFIGADDAQARVTQEFTDAKADVRRLRLQFEREEADRFVGFAAARLGDVRGQRGDLLRRRRSVRSVRAAAASSPLKAVTGVDDAPEAAPPRTLRIDISGRTWSEGSAVLDTDSESESDDGARSSRAGSTDSGGSVASSRTSFSSVFSGDDAKEWAEQRWEDEGVFEMSPMEAGAVAGASARKTTRPALKRANAWSQPSRGPREDEAVSPSSPAAAGTTREAPAAPARSPSWWASASASCGRQAWGAAEDEIDFPDYGF